MKNKKFLLFNMAVLFALVATVLIGKNNLDTNYETMEPTKIADEKIENELSEKEQKELEKKRERIHKKLRGEISELKPKKLSKKKKEDFEGFIQPDYHMYGEIEATPTPEPEQIQEAPEQTQETPEQYEQPEPQSEESQTMDDQEADISNEEPIYTETNTEDISEEE